MYNYSIRSNNLKSSEIRDILKLTEQPSVISFAGGLPAPELFPHKELLDITNNILINTPELALQYTTTQGYYDLRKQICDYNMNKVNVSTSPENILLTNGSQQALDFSSKLFINPNDSIICERPSYLGAINAFKSYEGNILEASLESDGINIEEVEDLLKNNDNVKFIYTIPDSQNPTGITMSIEKRKALAELASKYNILILEDCPYAEITYENDILPSIQSFDKTGHVIHFGSFSKILCPGLRIGWISASEELINKYIMIKQCSDLQCNTLSQLQISKYMEKYDLDKHISEINLLYKTRRNLMVEHLNYSLPSEVKFNIPKGGLFIWLELDESIDTGDLLYAALEKKVAFVIGRPFFANSPKCNFLRLNYSNMPEHQIIEGVTKLSEIINSFYRNIK